jgi:hypothetical protein
MNGRSGCCSSRGIGSAPGGANDPPKPYFLVDRLFVSIRSAMSIAKGKGYE